MNPAVLQMFTMITGQNKNYQHTLSKPTIVFDEILDDHQVQNLIKLYKSEENNTDKNIDDMTNNSNNDNNNNSSSNGNSNGNSNSNSNGNSNGNSNSNSNGNSNGNNNNAKNNNTTTNNTTTNTNKKITISDIDLIGKSVSNLISKDLVQSDLPILRDEMNKLSSLKSKYLSENNKSVVSQIDDLMNQIGEKVKKFRDKLETVANDSKNKINTITSHTSHSSNTEENADYLNLEIDPTIDTIDLKNDNYGDLKNIKIELKTDKKITDITLISYFLPINNHNITRFNNKFIIYFNNKITKITIPPNTYTLETLFKYITSQASYLNFTVDKNNIVTIKNTMDMDFDLLCDRIEETILPMLGFRDKINKYKQKTSYTASTVYNLDANHVYFSLSGSAMEPFHAELDKEITLNKSIKKSRSGIIMKQIILNFKNSVDQYYDFNKPFKICLKITYL
nr:ankyrin repeat domain containing protein [Mimivirus sp.]